ncbi:hypothetical protein [Caballeronia sp. GaOx3]|uniref:hypothetical protein n=1 Tax=Caballeronia sp. GaOx3 TaxID=2921740 RepID=UPI0028AB3488|nr:hypothetical protein [Caballeronia sp. GaOx3]
MKSVDEAPRAARALSLSRRNLVRSARVTRWKQLQCRQVRHFIRNADRAASLAYHVIASSAEAAYAVMIGAVTVRDYFTVFLLPTLIGNMLGGIAMVAIINHAAIAPEIDDARREE